MLAIIHYLDKKDYITRKHACLMAIYVLSLDFTSFKFLNFAGKKIEYEDHSPYIPKRLLFVIAYCLSRSLKNEIEQQKTEQIESNFFSKK